MIWMIGQKNPCSNFKFNNRQFGGTNIIENSDKSKWHLMEQVC